MQQLYSGYCTTTQCNSVVLDCLEGERRHYLVYPLSLSLHSKDMDRQLIAVQPAWFQKQNDEGRTLHFVFDILHYTIKCVMLFL